MDAYKAIVTKRDTSSYLAEPVDETQLTRVLQAARMAGSAKNAQLTRIVVVTDQDTRNRLTSCGDFTQWIGSAPVVLVLAMPTEMGRLFDLGRMAQNLMLAAHNEGLATCPVTFQHQDRIREAIGLPADHDGPMGITLGKPGPSGPNPMRAPRLPLEELVHRERW